MITKHVRKPKEIEAIKFNGRYSDVSKIEEFCGVERVKSNGISPHGVDKLLIDGVVEVRSGDYVVKNGSAFTTCNKYIFETEHLPKDKIGKISDGYHTFDELYYHRMILFSIICNTYKEKAWKSWKHSDGTMYDDYFIVGITTNEGDYTYHYHKDYWDMFDVPNYDFANKWDGHEPRDITRLLSLIK